MQISANKGVLPPSPGGGTLDIASQLSDQRKRHRRIMLGRWVKSWWLSILLALAGGVLAGVVGQFALNPLYGKYVILGALALPIGFPIVYWAIKNTTFALFLVTAVCTTWAPPMGSIKSLDLYLVYLLVPLLFFVVLVKAAFRERKFIWPSFRVLWPHLGLATMLIVSNIVVHFSWTVGVPETLNHVPLIVGEAFGLFIYLLTLFTILLLSALLDGKERWIEIIQRVYILLAVLISLVVLYEFRRLGGDTTSFRYTEPQIFWMKLRAIVQLISLGSILSYVRLLCATKWIERVIYALALVICLVALYVSLENSWWLEVGVALIVITLLAGRQLPFSELVRRIGLRGVILTIVGIVASPYILNKVNQIATQKQDDFLRLFIWQDGLRVWSKQPIFGVGPGNYWNYDQRFTHLPRFLTNFDKDGLGVAHNGFIQTLGEMGPIGEFLLLSFIAVMLIAAWRLMRRSDKDDPKTRNDYLLGLGCIGLILGSMVADFVSGEFFWPPRQNGSSHSLNQIMTTWVILGFLLYKDKLRRLKQAAEADPGSETEWQVEEQAGRTKGLAVVTAPESKPAPIVWSTWGMRGLAYLTRWVIYIFGGTEKKPERGRLGERLGEFLSGLGKFLDRGLAKVKYIFTGN